MNGTALLLWIQEKENFWRPKYYAKIWKVDILMDIARIIQKWIEFIFNSIFVYYCNVCIHKNKINWKLKHILRRFKSFFFFYINPMHHRVSHRAKKEDHHIQDSHKKFFTTQERETYNTQGEWRELNPLSYPLQRNWTGRANHSATEALI